MFFYGLQPLVTLNSVPSALTLTVGFGAMDCNLPYEFIEFEAMDANFLYECIGFGVMDCNLPYEFIGFGAKDAHFGYEFIRFWVMDCHFPRLLNS